jgi:hypothetical protein
MTLRRLTTVLLAAGFLGLAVPGYAAAYGGDYVVTGGSPAERGQVVAALDASAFDWSVVPARIQIHVAPGIDSYSIPGAIFVDSRLLAAGEFGWGVVQHEYAHQVDFLLFDAGTEQRLNDLLHGADWYGFGDPHHLRGVERFASTLAWAYWPSPQSAMRPTSTADEAGAMRPARFRRLMAKLLGVPQGARSFASRPHFSFGPAEGRPSISLGPRF